MTFTDKQIEKLSLGEVVRAKNGKRYGACYKCHKLVCLDKTLFNNLHFCLI